MGRWVCLALVVVIDGGLGGWSKARKVAHGKGFLAMVVEGFEVPIELQGASFAGRLGPLKLVLFL